MFKFCPNCGTKVIEGSKFCFTCGVSFEELQRNMLSPESTTSQAEVEQEQISAGIASVEQPSTKTEGDHVISAAEWMKSNPQVMEAEVASDDIVPINQNSPAPEVSTTAVAVVNQNLPVADSDRLYTVSGQHIIIEDDLAYYASIGRQFSTYAIEALQDAAKRYRAEVSGFDDMSDGMNRIYLDSVSQAVAMGRDILLEAGIMDYDIKRLIAACGKSIEIAPYLAPMVKAVQQLHHNVDSLMEQRAIERSNRSEWVGGGFGISGAISGALKAGMLNMGTNALRGIGDAFTDSSDRRQIEKWKLAIYNNEDYRSRFLNGIYYCCMNVFETVKDIMNLAYEEDKDLAEAYFNNYQRLYTTGSLAIEEYRQKLIEVLLLHPFEEKYYAELYTLNIFDYRTLRRLADFMGITYEFNNEVANLADDMLEKARPDDDDNIDALQHKQLILNELKEQGFLDEEDIDDVEEDLIESIAIERFLDLLPKEEDTAEEFMAKQQKIYDLQEEYPDIDFDDYIDEDDEELIAEKYNLAAEAGIMEAQYVMASVYSEDGSEDWFKWMILAADQGHSEAQNILGIQFYQGEYIEQNIDVAKVWFEKAAAQDVVESQYYLGHIAFLEQDYEKAVTYLNKAYDSGYLASACDLADCYIDGLGVAADTEKAKEVLKAAADEEDYPALYKYALLMEQDATDSEYEHILQMFNTAFEQGIVDAGVSAGEFLEKLYKENQDEGLMKSAAHYYEAAVEKKSNKAAFHLGGCYLDGKGVIQNDRLAFQYLYMAVEESAEAMNEVGVCYFNGVGIKKNYEKACNLFARAAEIGNVEALFNLAICVYYGLGIAEDKENGLQLLKQAASLGHTDATDLLAQLG